MDFAPLNMSPAPSGSPVIRSVITGQPAGSSGSSSVEKGFSSVLHKIRGEEGKGVTRTGDEVRSSKKADDPPRLKETKGLSASPSHIERSDNSSDPVTNERTTKDGKDEDEKHSTAEIESSQQVTAGSASAEQVPAVLAPVMVVQTQGHVPNQAELGSPDDVQSAKSGAESAGSPAKPALSASVLMNAPLTTHEPNKNQSTAGDASTPPQGTPGQIVDASMTQKKTNPPAALIDNTGMPLLVDQSGDNATGHVETYQAPIDAQGGAAPSSLPDHGVEHAAPVRTDTIVSDVKSDLVKVVATELKNLPPTASTIDQPQAIEQSSGEQEAAGSQPHVVSPHGQSVNGEGTQQFSEWWSDQRGRQQGNSEAKAISIESGSLPVTSGQTAESFAAASHSQTPIAPTIPSPGTLTSHIHPAPPVVELTPQPLASMIRSVVVDVAQQDLGHVNIRVAMMNDSVHAHFSTDRTDVGQFLMNGQDRLQTALQANGLDMGQFRVDIDRQPGGRSFQQGLFHEQGQTWSQGSQGFGKEQAQGRPDETRSLLHGRLNLVA